MPVYWATKVVFHHLMQLRFRKVATLNREIVGELQWFGNIYTVYTILLPSLNPFK